MNFQENNIIVEWAPFEVEIGVSDEVLINASNRIQSEFLVTQKGYIKRELLKGKSNLWADLVYWASKEDANTALKNAETSEACRQYFSLMINMDQSDPSECVLHYEKMAGWE